MTGQHLDTELNVVAVKPPPSFTGQMPIFSYKRSTFFSLDSRYVNEMDIFSDLACLLI